MPDVNLLRDTKQPEDPKKADPTPPKFDVTDPAAEAKPGLGGFFRSLLKRRTPGVGPELGVPTRTVSSSGSMSIGRAGSNERILSETKKAGRTGVIPLPEDEGGYNVNLLTEDLVTTFDPRRKLIQLGLVALGSAIVVAAAYFGLQIYGKSVSKQATTSKEELANVEKQISDLGPEQTTLTDTSKKLAAIKTLIDRHVRWTRFFAQLEHYTLPTVTYGTSFKGDITGSWSLSATTSSFDEVAKQYLVLQQAVTNNDFISTFTINGATIAKSNGGDVVSFTVSFTILPSLLENPPEVSNPAAVNSVGTVPSNANQNSSTSTTASQKLTQDAANLTKLSQAVVEMNASICDLFDHPSDISFFPQFAQADVQKTVSTSSKAAMGCSSISAANMGQGILDMKTDQDKDGLNLIYENTYGTSDTSVDSDGNGIPDYQQVKTQYIQDQQPSTNTNTTQ